MLDAARVDAAGDAAAADGNQRFLDLDPVGGAACGCGAGAGPDGLALHVDGVTQVSLRQAGTWVAATRTCDPACHGAETW